MMKVYFKKILCFELLYLVIGRIIGEKASKQPAC